MRMTVLALVTLVWCWMAAGQERGIAGVSSNPGDLGPQKWALIFGAGDYLDPSLSDLPNAVNDARAIRDMLVSAPGGFLRENVLLLADGEEDSRLPTRANLMRFLRSRLALVGPEDTILDWGVRNRI